MNSSAAVLFVCLCLAAQALAFEISLGSCRKESGAVTPFLPTRYVGKWYEIERFAQIWELAGKCATADYELDQDVSGRVTVKNTMQTIFGGEVSQSGYADLTSQDKGELNVVFNVPIFGKREAPYWVLATDYDNYSLVYSCTDLLGFLKIESVWVLGRAPTLTDAAQKEVDAAIELNKINKRALKPTKQDC
ncbi:hypothetical protein FOCC_FOCC005198 [Frankliniella occidentalis]|nr:hypothetical protein FOCC_FOCC005198 [Frankliniella occidentalis]